jgi:hypothetical protein
VTVDIARAGPFANNHPSDIVAAMYGSDVIRLAGFGAAPMPPLWLRPGLRFVSADSTPISAAHEVAARRRTLMGIYGATVTIGLTAAVFAGFSLGVAGRPDIPTSGASWSVIAVEEPGVILRAEGAIALVRNGETLPNGEQLQATLPTQRAYITDKATVVVQDVKRPGPARATAKAPK